MKHHGFYFIHIWTSATSIFRAENNLQKVTSRWRILDFTCSPDLVICWFGFYGLFWNPVIIARPLMSSPSELQQLPKNMKHWGRLIKARKFIISYSRIIRSCRCQLAKRGNLGGWWDLRACPFRGGWHASEVWINVLEYITRIFRAV